MADWDSGARIGIELGNQLGSAVGRYYKGKMEGLNLKERIEDREAAALEARHKKNTEAAEASRQDLLDYQKEQREDFSEKFKEREQTETERHNREMEKTSGVRAASAGGKANDQHYRFVKGSLDRASKDVSAWMSSHPGMTPPEGLMAKAKAAKKDHDTYGKAMGYDITDVPEIPEVKPVQKPGLLKQGADAVLGMFGAGSPPPDPVSAPGEGWRDYQN